MENTIEKYFNISKLSTEEANNRVIAVLISSNTIEELHENIEKEIGGAHEFN